VGGDLYDCIRLHDDSWVFYVADVAGKGLPASLVMAAVWSKIRSDAPFRVDTAELLSGVNNDMYDFLVRNEVFVTIVLGRFLPEAGFLQLSKAGHLWPIWRGAEGLKQVPRLTGVPLGVIPDTGYSVAEIHLDPGDDMLFLTDGVTEAVNPQGEMFGEARVERLVAEAGALPCGPVVAEAVSAWRGGGHPGDDTTLLELWREP
jgi:serine phosphatase RsbU (regulator of sigma subunit)